MSFLREQVKNRDLFTHKLSQKIGCDFYTKNYVNCKFIVKFRCYIRNKLPKSQIFYGSFIKKTIYKIV